MTKLPPPTNEGCASPSSGWSTYPVLLVGSDIVRLILPFWADTDLNGSPPVYRAATLPFEQLRHPHRRVAQPCPMSAGARREWRVEAGLDECDRGIGMMTLSCMIAMDSLVGAIGASH